MKIRTGLDWTLCFANLTRFIVGTLQMASGVAAFGLSATTTAFVIQHVFPNPYVPIAAGVSLDLAKVSSIFMHRFAQNRSLTSVLLGGVWRGTLISIAALFTCIAVSGMLMNKNLEMVFQEKREQIIQQNAQQIIEENQRYKGQTIYLQNEMTKERVTGIGERYKKLELALGVVNVDHQNQMAKLNDDLTNQLSQLDTQNFDNDRRVSDPLFDNFRKTINKVFSVTTTYSGWIMVLVIVISLTIELTIYVVFDNLACGILPYVKALQEQAAIEMKHKLALHQKDMSFEQRKEDILSEGVIEEMEEAKKAKVITDKFSNYNLNAKKTLERDLTKARRELNNSIIESVSDILSSKARD